MIQPEPFFLRIAARYVSAVLEKREVVVQHTVEADEPHAPTRESIDAGHLGAQHLEERNLLFEVSDVQSDMPDLQMSQVAPLD